MKSIFYKEWIKTQRIIYLLYTIFTGFIVYTFLSIQQIIRTGGPVQLWETIIQKDICITPMIKFLPLLAGVLLAVSQFVPEMQNKRLKLTLHLPLPETKIVFSLLFFGLLNLILLFAISEVALLIGLSMKFAPEIVCANFWTTIPWMLGGLAAYLVTSWICLEPVWKWRIFDALTGCCFVAFFYWDAKSGGYITFLPWLSAFILTSFFFPFYSTIRFKEGKQ